MTEIIRVEKKCNYVVLSKEFLQNKNLSLKTKGLMAIMLSLPSNWDFTEKGLSSLTDSGRDTIRTCLKEMEDAGYLIRNQNRDGGKFSDVSYVLYEELPLTEKPLSEKPMSENPTQLNNNIPNNIKPNKKEKRKRVSQETKNSLTLDLYNYWNEKSQTTNALVNHKDISPRIEKAIRIAKRELGLKELSEFKTLIDRFILVFEKSQFNEPKYRMSKRAMYQFFGQKDYNSPFLICSEYMDDGTKWIKYKSENKVLTNTEKSNSIENVNPFEERLKELKHKVERGEL